MYAARGVQRGVQGSRRSVRSGDRTGVSRSNRVARPEGVGRAGATTSEWSSVGSHGDVWREGADHRPTLGSGRWAGPRRHRNARGLRQVDDADVDRTDVRILLVMDKAALGEPQLLSRGFGDEQ